MTQNPEFLNPPFTPNNLDRCIVRSSILKAFQETLPQLQGTLLDVGCGQMSNQASTKSKSKPWAGGMQPLLKC